MKGLVTLAIIFLALTAHADLINWSKGSVVERDGQVRIGEISFQSVDLILFKTEGNVMVYTPHHIKAFFYYDEDARVNRKFNSLQVEPNHSPLFYEYVAWGKVQLVRLAKNRNLIKGKLRDAFDYDYLVSWNTNYTRLRDFKRDVFPLLVGESPILEQLVHDQRLNPSNIADVVSIIKLYNRVVHTPVEIIARNDQ